MRLAGCSGLLGCAFDSGHEAAQFLGVEQPVCAHTAAQVYSEGPGSAQGLFHIGSTQTTCEEHGHSRVLDNSLAE